MAGTNRGSYEERLSMGAAMTDIVSNLLSLIYIRVTHHVLWVFGKGQRLEM